jgi:hypothetical protein
MQAAAITRGPPRGSSGRHLQHYVAVLARRTPFRPPMEESPMQRPARGGRVGFGEGQELDLLHILQLRPRLIGQEKLSPVTPLAQPVWG